MDAATAAAKLLQSCPTLCDTRDGSPPGSPIPEILQTLTLEWVAISFSNAWKWKVKVKSLSRVRLSATPWTAAYQALPSMAFSSLITKKSLTPHLAFNQKFSMQDTASNLPVEVKAQKWSQFSTHHFVQDLCSITLHLLLSRCGGYFPNPLNQE